MYCCEPGESLLGDSWPHHYPQVVWASDGKNRWVYSQDWENGGNGIKLLPWDFWRLKLIKWWQEKIISLTCIGYLLCTLKYCDIKFFIFLFKPDHFIVKRFFIDLQLTWMFWIWVIWISKLYSSVHFTDLYLNKV